MKIVISEKQLEYIKKNIKEVNDVSSESPKRTDTGQFVSTSSGSSGGASYPEVGKWESGVSRGPGNQIGNTKWSDTVGSKLTRGKANQLK